MKRLFLVISVALFASVLLATCVSAEVPHLIRFQGKVTNKEGAPLAGDYNITFRIYNAGTGGALMWSETQSAVPVNGGIFTVLLGNVVALDLPFDESYWLSMELNDDGEMFPRQRLSSVGYAIHAETAERFIETSVIPKGLIILWRGSSCPAGYSRVSELDGKFIVGGATYNSAAGGSNTHNHGGASGTGGNHNHSYSGTTSMGDFPSGASSGSDGFIRWQHTHTYSGSTNTKGSHSHTIPSADNRPEFATVIFCEKD